jgi:hypothetical protein
MECKHTNVSVADNGEARCMNCRTMIKPARQVQPAPAYYRYLEDVRRLGWCDVGDMPPLEDAYYAAWPSPAGGRWIVMRIEAGGMLPPQATHWHRDALGLPLVP